MCTAFDPLKMSTLVLIFTFIWFSKASVSAECGGEFNTTEGEVVSPDYTKEPNNPSLVCEWTVGYKNAFGVRITVEYFQVPSQNVYGIFLVDVNNNRTLQQITKQPTEPPYVFAANKMKIQMVSLVSNRTGLSFKIKYAFLTCGGPVDQPNGELFSPSYTNLPTLNVVCEWQFHIPYTSAIGINVLNFFAPTKGIQQLTVGHGSEKTILNATGNSQFPADNLTLKLQTDVSDSAGLRFQIHYDSVTGREEHLSVCSASPSPT